MVSSHGLILERKIDIDLKTIYLYEPIGFEVSGDRIQAVHMLLGYIHSILIDVWNNKDVIMDKKLIDGRINNVQSFTKKTDKFIPTRIHANSLFKFMKRLNYLENIILNKKVLPRYVIESVKYLHLKNINYMAFPMSCFCDINLHNLDEHIESYGNYGIAFSKEWGIKNNIQPIQYINENSALRKDFTSAFNRVLRSNINTQNENVYSNFIFLQLMFYKPHAIKRYGITKRYTDECEWRYIADVHKYGYPVALWDKKSLVQANLDKMSDSLINIDSVGLDFDYEDIKYIIVSNQFDFQRIINVLGSLQIDAVQKESLISKILIWDMCREDF